MPEPEPEPLYFEPIGAGHYASFSDTVRTVIRDEASWETYRQQLSPRTPFREVDFSQAMVLLVVLQAPSGGYSVNFESVEKYDSTIEASYVLLRPGDDCVTVMALTQPFQAVMVRRAEGEVQFRQRVESLPCSLP